MEAGEKKYFEEILRDQNNQYREVAERAPIGIIKINSLGDVVFVNSRAINILGLSLDGKFGINLLSYSPLVKAGVAKDVRECLEKGVSREYEGYYTSASGRRLYIRISMSPLVPSMGKVAGALLIVEDFTGRRKLEDAVRRNEEMFWGIFNNSPNGIVLVSKDHIIVDVNPAVERITGYNAEELRGRDVYTVNYMFLPEERKRNLSLEEYREKMQDEYGAKPGPPRDEFVDIVIQRKDGEIRFLREWLFTIRVGDEPLIVNVKRDITSEKILEKQLLHAQKMESIGNLAGGIAHDFNNLLTVISGYADVALMELDKGSFYYETFKAIKTAGEKAEKLVKQLLAFSRKDLYEPTIIDLNALIKRFEPILARYISEDIKIEILLDDNIPNIKADPGQVEQILINLVVNARDAIEMRSEKGSEKRIRISTSVKHVERDYVRLNPEAREGVYVAFSVSDTGIGIEQSILDKIFDPFFTTKEVGKGTGLGLSTVYGIVKQNGGFITVSSVVARGTRFDIFWPATTEKQEDDRSKPDTLPEKSVEELKATVLFVEDEGGILKFGVRVLERLGCKVLAASNGVEALKVVREAGSELDIVITDYVMPEMNGEELVEKLLDIYPDIRVIFTSGYTNNRLNFEDLAVDRVVFLSKPYTVSELTRVVKNMIYRR